VFPEPTFSQVSGGREFGWARCAGTDHARAVRTVPETLSHPRSTVIIMTMSTMSISVDEFLAGDFPEGSELFEGSIWVNDPTFRHQELCRRLMKAILLAGSDHYGFGGNWRVNDYTLLKPDVWWVDDDTWTALRPEVVHSGLPQLAIEVRSPDTWHRDVTKKWPLYLASGVLEVWLVDGVNGNVRVGRAGGTTFTVSEGTLTTPLLPALALSLAELFAD